jgi:feruloyl esterase
MADGFIYFMGDQGIRHMALKEPSFDTLTFAAKDHATKLQAVSRLVDASSDDLRAFRRRGGKLLMLHGTLDMAVTPHNTHAYWRRLQRRFGSGLRDFARYYVVPGYGHGSGVFTVGWDSLGALDAWVERGEAPREPVATDLARTTAGRTRPLCDYPAWPRYRGAGDPDRAASFECVSGR